MDKCFLYLNSVLFIASKLITRNQNIIHSEEIEISISENFFFSSVQCKSFQYFWDKVGPASDLVMERFIIGRKYHQNDQKVITLGNEGYALNANLVGIKSGFFHKETGT